MLKNVRAYLTSLLGKLLGDREELMAELSG